MDTIDFKSTWRSLWDKHFAAIVYSYHALLALYFHFGLDVNILADSERSWDWFWQTLPMELLKSQPVESIWNLHSVPPMHNVLMALLVKLAPYPEQLLHLLHIALGSFFAVLLYSVMINHRVNRVVAQLLAVVVASDPSLFMFEAYLLYDITTAFFLLLTVWSLSSYVTKGKNIYILVFVGAANALALNRSTFHILYVVCCILLGLSLVKGWRWRYLVTAVVLTLPLLVCIGKNKAKFGFAGTSSWMGLSVWKIIHHQLPQEYKTSWVNEGLIPRHVIDNPPYALPSSYHYNTTSTIAALGRNNYNNIAIPQIARDYGKASVAAIIDKPKHYLFNVWQSYLFFCQPTPLYKHFRSNVD